MNVSVREYALLTGFCNIKVTTTIPISLLSLFKLTPIVDWRISSPQFCTKLYKQENDQQSALMTHKNRLLSHHFTHLAHAHSEKWYYTCDLS